MSEFYLSDEHVVGLDGKEKIIKDVLYFKFEKSGFNDRANRDHIKNFEVAYANFKAAHPDFVLTWQPEIVEASVTPAVEDEVVVPAEELLAEQNVPAVEEAK